MKKKKFKKDSHGIVVRILAGICCILLLGSVFLYAIH